jgi:predicted NAD-dependent protein-ADP-ribosyltransferase YbiA (DUF1768 family)
MSLDNIDTIDNIDTLYFHSKSKDVAPGKGVNENVKDPKVYEELAKIKDWRKVLSNFHMYPFEYKGNTYNTIEHVYQSQKIALVSPDKAYLFTLESGHDIGKGDGSIARKNRKLIVLNKAMLSKWSKITDDVMYEAALSKYKACPEASNVLKATGDAELWHLVSRSSHHCRFAHLERVRALLRDILN